MRSTPNQQQQVGEFFAANSDRLERGVARKIRGRRDLIENACANAWAILLRRPDITLDTRGLKWLTTVAVNEALMLLRRTRDETGGESVPRPTYTRHAAHHLPGGTRGDRRTATSVHRFHDREPAQQRPAQAVRLPPGPLRPRSRRRPAPRRASTLPARARAERYVREQLMPRPTFQALQDLSDTQLAEMFNVPPELIRERRRDLLEPTDPPPLD